jgi:hypothetical protein
VTTQLLFELFRFGRQLSGYDHRLPECVYGAQSFRDRPMDFTAGHGKREENGHRTAQAVAGYVQRVQRMIQAGIMIHDGSALAGHCQFVDDRKPRGPDVPVKSGMNPDFFPAVAQWQRTGLRSHIRIPEPAAENARFRSAVTQNNDAATMTLDQICSREDEHRVNSLRDAHAAMAFETEPSHHRSHRVGVGVRVSCARSKHVRDSRISLSSVCEVCGVERGGEVFVNGEGSAANPANNPFMLHKLLL